MTKALIAASMLAYLSCAAPPKTQVPIVEVPYSSSTMEDKGIKRVYSLPKDSAKTPADFIVKTLEEKIRENHAVYASGNIRIKADHLYDIYYKFDLRDMCAKYSGNPLYKGMLFIDFRDWDFMGGTNSSTSFNIVRPPFYITENFIFYRTARIPTAPPALIGALNVHSAFPEAQKLYGEMLIYIAEELKQKPQNRVLDGKMISIHHTERNISQREEKLFQRYKRFLDALPKQQPFPPGTFISPPCNP